MNLLLLLSALLSALTGVSAAVRTPQVTQSVTGSSASAAQVAARRVAVRAHPVQSLPSLSSVAGTVEVVKALPERQPLWASRRRE
jgi:hypothetical protein